MMQLNHVANRLDARHFETVVEMLKAKLRFVELRRTERAIWLRQPGVGQTEDFGRLKAFAGGSLFEFLGERCGVTLARSNVVIAAVRADAERARLLEVRAGTPLLLLRETHCDPAGKPVLFTVNHHNSDLVQFILTRAGLPS
jgi:UTRA domain